MNEEIKKAVEKSRAAMQKAYPLERERFKSLILSNPNYFGNLSESQFKSKLSISGNTHYEELVCVGYHPQESRLEGVVYIYETSGYGTDICGSGTPEYVRFYLSFDNGATWDDQGITSFQAFNIPKGTEGSKRLEYAVSLPVDLNQRLCITNLLIKMRAILSWNNIPPANQPNWTPIWGNVQEVTIQVQPRHFFFPPEIFEVAKIKVNPVLQQLINPEVAIPIEAKDLEVNELDSLYAKKGIPVHRFAFKELMSFASGKTPLNSESFLSIFPNVQIDPNIGDLLFPKTDGDTSYEELKCVGLDPNSPNTLVGIIQLKKSSGYSGGPCTNGSTEYVTFWADFDGNGSFETCLGTAKVQVYDLNNIPPEGVYYAARLPVNLSSFRQPCKEGPKVVNIRATLSWNVAVPCSDPNYIPTWGNREETLIHIAPLAGAPAGQIAILGGIPVSMIDNVIAHTHSGLTTPAAVFATNNMPPDSLGRPCPFAGRVTVQGFPLLGHSYKVEVIPAGGGVPVPVVKDLVLTRFDGSTYVYSADTNTGRFAYRPFQENVNSVLAQWDSTGDEKWVVKLTTFDSGGVQVGIDEHLIQLDNTWPDAFIEITSGTGNCGKFDIGTVLAGNFIARDLHFARYSITVEPAVNPAGVGVPSPNAGIVETAPAPGNAWTLDTTGMKSCGYIIRIVAVDLAIIDSQSTGHRIPDSAGFCLKDAKG